MSDENLWDTAKEVGTDVLDYFSELHPHIRMNRREWADLREMIEREVVGRFGENERAIGAFDLVDGLPCGLPPASSSDC